MPLCWYKEFTQLKSHKDAGKQYYLLFHVSKFGSKGIKSVEYPRFLLPYMPLGIAGSQKVSKQVISKLFITGTRSSSVFLVLGMYRLSFQTKLYTYIFGSFDLFRRSIVSDRLEWRAEASLRELAVFPQSSDKIV